LTDDDVLNEEEEELCFYNSKKKKKNFTLIIIINSKLENILSCFEDSVSDVLLCCVEKPFFEPSI